MQCVSGFKGSAPNLSLIPVEKTPVHRSNQSDSKLSTMAKTKELSKDVSYKIVEGEGSSCQTSWDISPSPKMQINL